MDDYDLHTGLLVTNVMKLDTTGVKTCFLVIVKSAAAQLNTASTTLRKNIMREETQFPLMVYLRMKHVALFAKSVHHKK